VANRPIRPPRGLLIAIAILLVVAVVSGPAVQALLPEEQRSRAILLLGLPFLTIFAAILLGFIYSIFVVASRLNGRITQRAYKPVEAVIIAGIVLGVIGMFQPISMLGYQIGFPVLLFSTLAFIVWSHVTPRGEHAHEDIGPVSVSTEIVHPRTAVEGGE
jgi:hypothetical protein